MPVRKRAPAGPGVLDGFRVDPLLIGADREFLNTFPRKIVSETGALPLRRYGGFGLVVVRSEGEAQESLETLQRASDTQLMAALPLNRYGVDLFLRYWDMAEGRAAVPPIWVPEARRAYLKRLGQLASIRGRAHPVALLTSLILTSPLNNQHPVLVVKTGDESQVLFLGGAGGLRTALRFPAAWHEDLLARLKLEFGLKASERERRGGEERGLQDLSALVLPPSDGETLILEPKRRR